MKKSKHLSNLQQEKMRLRIQQLEQEKAIRKLWNELKEDLQPRNFLKNKLADLGHTKTEETRLFPLLLNYGTGYLSRRVTKMAEQKIESTLQQGINKLMGKINPKKNK